jgi:hypothetical protein
MPLFFEYFHGDTGRGVGASHQTGWTALVSTILRDLRTLASPPESAAGYENERDLERVSR